MKLYRGFRTGDLNSVEVSSDGARWDRLHARPDLGNHGTRRFDWGRPSAAASQLALAICANYLGDDDHALRVHRFFRRRVLDGLAADHWTITGDRMGEIITEVEMAAALGG